MYGFVKLLHFSILEHMVLIRIGVVFAVVVFISTMKIFKLYNIYSFLQERAMGWPCSVKCLHFEYAASCLPLKCKLQLTELHMYMHDRHPRQTT